jgi:hypothetical protein
MKYKIQKYNNLIESDNISLSDVNDCITFYIEQINRNEIYYIKDLISELKLRLFVSDIDIKNILNDHKNEILNCIKNYIINLNNESKNINSERNYIFDLSKWIDIIHILKKRVNWPELLQIVNKCKNIIIKCILNGMQINNAHLHVIKLLVSEISKFGVKWPELHIIDKSLNYINDDKVYESNTVHISDLSKSVVNLMVIQIKNAIKGDDLGHMHLISNTIDRLKTYRINNEEISESLNIAKTDIINYLEFLATTEPMANIRYFLNNITKLNTIIKPIWPEIEELLKKYKPRIIKYVLIKIKDQLYYPAGETTFLLKNILKLDWPELNSITKSLEAGENKSKQND